ncbi:hypothetical protein VTN96DRAFT_5996 [Rasamsonia emersonii]|uniref:Extracellular thaumatin domain protein n=1 Tax=Rasamsonia emersonii (strain ATCC 16479 / CBS 393.64 / IMI 116815) TaxID=1408163 RepID=A0A0F4YZD6_RASE3|nr:hypothetical protein T310_2541 [Rasamsonia emersonii CBS 393.64]KKA23475.1 hypothetical protein T310_2541 [Rasamsonia emersonii CBS 393.64]
MKFTQVFGIAALLASAASALPLVRSTNSTSSSSTGGGVTINNNMDQTIYLWSVSDDFNAPMVTVPKGQSYSENWRINPNGGGISIKMATTPSQADVLQFEYTLANPTIFWDLSCINMGTNSLFTKVGFAVTSNNPQCESATCAPGDTACADAYLVPDDNQATRGCDADTHLTLNIGSSSS